MAIKVLTYRFEFFLKFGGVLVFDLGVVGVRDQVTDPGEVFLITYV